MNEAHYIISAWTFPLYVVIPPCRVYKDPALFPVGFLLYKTPILFKMSNQHTQSVKSRMIAPNTFLTYVLTQEDLYSQHRRQDPRHWPGYLAVQAQ